MHPEATWYLVCYDIRDDAIRTRVYKTLRGFGTHLQYSVFRCALTPKRLAQLRWFLEEVIQPRTDQVMLVRLGNANRDDAWRAIVVGRPLPPMRRGARILGD